MLHLICPNPALDRTILVENYQESLVNRPILVHENAGGKSFNVATALRSHGESAVNYTIHTMLGGKMGDFIQELNQLENNPLIVTRVDKNTRTCTITIDTVTEKTYLMYEKGFDLDSDLLDQFTHNLLSNVVAGDNVVFSGSLMQGMPETYIADIGQAIPEGARLVVDTSGAALKQALKANPVLVKINDEELAELTGREIVETRDVVEALSAYSQIPYFIVTLGGKGVVAKLGRDVFQLTFPKIRVKNPIASGDFFLGILCHDLEEKGIINRDTVIRACAVATANCLEWTPKIDPDKVDQLISKIELKEL